jgi:hypothetical protein
MTDRRLNAEWEASTPIRSVVLRRDMPARHACNDEEEIVCIGDWYVIAYAVFQTSITVFPQCPCKARRYEEDPEPCSCLR